MSDTNLLPCPICGGTPSIETKGLPTLGRLVAVKCLGCGLMTRYVFPDKIEAAWNTRHHPTPEALSLEELEGMRGEMIHIHYIGECVGFCEDTIAPYYGDHQQYIHEHNGMLRACDLLLQYYGKQWVAANPKNTRAKE